MFGVAVAAYVVAVFQRSSIGVAGVDATERFGIAATQLSVLAVVQLAVYALLQIPVGVILDRVGPKLLLTVGATLMVAGQTTLAFSDTLTVAVIGRILVGAGDATTFISAIRLLATWFNGRTLPIASQLLGTTGQLGQILSAIPLAVSLQLWGWTPSYLSAAALSAIVAVVIVMVVTTTRPEGAQKPAQQTWPESFDHLRDSLSRPGTQLGFWSHFVTQSSVTMFSLLWGFPFLSVGLGYGPAAASGLLTLIVASAAISGPVLGILTARYPLRRSNLVIGIVVAMAIAWTVVLVWPGEPPLALIVVLLVVIAVGGPGSLIGLDFARSFNPLRAIGSASGVVNVGGFLATFVMVFLVGLVLDLLDRADGGSGVPAQLYSFEHFRIAFLVQYVVIGAGVVLLIRARRRTRRRMHEEEGIEVAPLWVALVRRWKRRRGGSGSESPLSS